MQTSISSSDESLRTTILVVLALDDRTAKLQLHVGVMKGIAHLAGSVETLAERDAVESIVQGADNVRGVVNRIEAPGAPSPARTINLNLDDQP